MANSRNLLNSVFAFRPTENHSARENFLSEAFAHLLESDSEALDAWLSAVLGEPVSSAAVIDISTRNSERMPDDATVKYPDLRVDARLPDGRLITIFSEHKWDAPYNRGQLENYAKLAGKSIPPAHLIFIGANLGQTRAALSAVFGEVPFRALLWEQVYTRLAAVQPRSYALEQFLEFMNTQGLSPDKPVTPVELAALPAAEGVQGHLVRLASILLNEFSWQFFPERYRSSPLVKDRWGRIAIEFVSPGWAPTITVGFLYWKGDHQVEFTQPGRGVDLMLRIEAHPDKHKNSAQAITALRAKADAIRASGATVLFRGDPGNGNRHTMMIVQRCLADLVGGAATLRDQAGPVHRMVAEWARILFADGQLETPLSHLD